MRYFFQWMILITMALSLVACSGSSGSDGATGAAGTNGTNGTNGTDGTDGDNATIALPTNSGTLAIAAVATDTDTDLGQVANTFTLSGTDNLSVDARDRYYGYLSTDGSAKSSYIWDNSTVGISGYSSVVASSLGAWPIDTRLKQADNLILTFSENVNLGDGDGSTTHIIVCKGNEAGDATGSGCASAALNDRGWGERFSDTTDNVSRIFLIQSGTDSFAVVVADDDDNVTAVQAVTDTKSNTTAPTLGSASSAITESTDFSPDRDATVFNSKTYVLSGKDNGTLYEDGTSVATNIFGAAIEDQVILSTDGTNLIGIADNDSNVAVRNLTTPASPAIIGANLTRTSGTPDPFCGAVGDGRALVAINDNQSLDNASSILVSSTDIDNATGWDISTTTISASLDNDTSIDCAMAYAGSSGDNRTVWLAVDNTTDAPANTPGNTIVYKLIDNGTAVTSSQYANLTSTVAQSLNMFIYSETLYLAVDNLTGGALVYKDNGTALNLLTSSEDPVYGAANTPVDIAVSSDGKKIAVAGYTDNGTAAMSYPALRIFYDE